MKMTLKMKLCMLYSTMNTTERFLVYRASIALRLMLYEQVALRPIIAD